MIEIEKTLPLDCNVETAKAFLSLFECTVEERETDAVPTTLTVYRNDLKVGFINIGCDLVMMHAETPLGTLTGTFPSKNDGPTCRLINDKIHITPTDEHFSVIEYSIFDNERQITGTSHAECFLDRLKGSSDCAFHHKLKFKKDGKVYLKLALMYDGISFRVDEQVGDDYEFIGLSPHRDYDYYIRHSISINKGKPDECRDDTVIGTGGESHPESIRIFTLNGSMESNLTFCGTFPKKGYKKGKIWNRTPFIFQMGEIMRDIDPKMFAKLKSIREQLMMDEVSLLDRLIDSSFRHYTDEELNALFGFVPKNIKDDTEKKMHFLPKTHF